VTVADPIAIVLSLNPNITLETRGAEGPSVQLVRTRGWTERQRFAASQITAPRTGHVKLVHPVKGRVSHMRQPTLEGGAL